MAGDSWEWETPMLWLWLVGSIQLQVSFAKEPSKRDDIVHKRRIILSMLLTVGTPSLKPDAHRHTRPAASRALFTHAHTLSLCHTHTQRERHTAIPIGR